MNGGTLALTFAGLLGFGAGAYIVATEGEPALGIALMAMGLVFQALVVRRLKPVKKEASDAG